MTVLLKDADHLGPLELRPRPSPKSNGCRGEVDVLAQIAREYSQGLRGTQTRVALRDESKAQAGPPLGSYVDPEELAGQLPERHRVFASHISFPSSRICLAPQKYLASDGGRTPLTQQY
eukprot:2990766-Pyramimonas_sp.AAC.1